MKKLNELGERLESSPTIMDISSEISFINELMSVDIDDILKNKNIFCKIVADIELSHTDAGYFELSPENDHIFVDFYNWLSSMKVRAGLDLSDEIIENFNMTSDEFAKIMSKYK